jgi:hypothetical protein
VIENGELLRKQLNASFDIEELKTLCSDLGVDYDSLTGEGKAAKVRELIAYYDRRGTTDELIMAAYRLRPNQRRWPAIASRNQGKTTNRMMMMQVGRLEIQMDQVFSIIYKIVTMSVVNFGLLMFLLVGILLILMRIL